MSGARAAWRVAVALFVLLPAPAVARAAAAAAAPAVADGSALDEQARDLFRAQRYAEALAIYQRLRVETGHPTYLRNIGRCHQMLRQPAPAIAAFEDYLRQASKLDAAERGEIDGYIAEMRRLQLSAPPPPAPAAPPPPAAAPGTSPTADVTATTAAEPAAHPSLLRRWWFWAGIGAVAAAAFVVVAASSGQDRLPCPSGAVCP